MGFWDITAGAVVKPIGEAIYGQHVANQQFNRQKELMGLQMKNQQILNAQGHQMQLDMWDKTNYKEQMKQMKMAGLNPALLYGKGGGGGTTTGNQGGGSATGGSASMAPMMDLSALNITKSKAELELMNAQADNLRAEAEAKRGYTKEQSQATTANIVTANKLLETQIGTEEAKKTSFEIDNQLKSIELLIKDSTKNNQIEIVNQELQKLVTLNKEAQNQVKMSSLEADRKEEMLDQLVRQNNLNIALTRVKITAEKQGIELNKARINEITTQLEQAWSELEINKDKNKVSREGFESQREIARGMQKAMIDVADKQGIYGLNRTLGEWVDDYLPSPRKGQKGYRPTPTRKR